MNKYELKYELIMTELDKVKVEDREVMIDNFASSIHKECYDRFRRTLVPVRGGYKLEFILGKPCKHCPYKYVCASFRTKDLIKWTDYILKYTQSDIANFIKIMSKNNKKL